MIGTKPRGLFSISYYSSFCACTLRCKHIASWNTQDEKESKNGLTPSACINLLRLQDRIEYTAWLKQQWLTVGSSEGWKTDSGIIWVGSVEGCGNLLCISFLGS